MLIFLYPDNLGLGSNPSLTNQTSLSPVFYEVSVWKGFNEFLFVIKLPMLDAALNLTPALASHGMVLFDLATWSCTVWLPACHRAFQDGFSREYRKIHYLRWVNHKVA